MVKCYTLDTIARLLFGHDVVTVISDGTECVYMSDD